MSCYSAPLYYKQLLVIQCVIISSRNPLKANLREKQVSDLCNERSILGFNGLFVCSYLCGGIYLWTIYLFVM